MNCLYEAIAGVYVRALLRVMPPREDDLGDAEENLESCRAGLASRERGLEQQADKLFKAAAEKRRQGDVSGARFALLERKRVLGRLEKVRSGIILLDKQLDALKSSELDKELMNSLKLSSQAMRRAGIGQGVEEAENVMNELDDQIREASELTTVLATPLVNAGEDEEDLLDVDAELGLGAVDLQAPEARKSVQPAAAEDPLKDVQPAAAEDPRTIMQPAAAPDSPEPVPEQLVVRPARVPLPRVASHMDY